MKKAFLLVPVLLCNLVHAQQGQAIADASKFLPGPPDDTSVEYLKDITQYDWGKSMRNTPAWQHAATDINEQLGTYINAFSTIIGLQISKLNTPRTYEVLDYVITYSQNTIEKARKTFAERKPPFARFGENSLVPGSERQYATISSYPSSFAFMGWLTALTLTEICPDKQNDILVRGYNFGTSSIISGYNWDSDVTSGRLLACALSTLLHSQTNFNNMMKSARTEYEQKTGTSTTIISSDQNSSSFPNDNLPKATAYLQEPPALESVLFSYDLNQHILNSRKRVTTEGKIATADVDVSTEYLAGIFSTAFGKTISPSETPHLYSLISKLNQTGAPAYQAVKEKYMRICPYVLLNQKTSYEPDEDSYMNQGSYPSGHSSEGWLTAMVLAEINSANAEELLARAYLYGQSRVITGYNWQSDVDAGRLVGSTIYAYLHTCDEFVTMMNLAKSEYNGSTGIKATTTGVNAGDEPLYKLDGTLIKGTPSIKGIFIQGNKKIIVK
jgi:hypothetical protein